ncbi:MAG: hypothetical protein KAV87_64625 [Desulfobacteraceae bacterium]|nr:hypothetical protein [Desulfobacteraceae bacterium]
MAATITNNFPGVRTCCPFSLYAHVNKATPSITVDASVNDEALTVDSIVDVAAGDVIGLCEGTHCYQSLVTSTAANTINLGSPLDFAFTTSGTMYTGHWNIALDGSGTTQVASIVVPPDVCFEIYEIIVSMTDDVAMDSSKFGGIAALTNGILFRIVNGTTKNLPLIVNNIGFQEAGFDLQYDAKAPAGTYGISAKKNYFVSNGVVLKLDGATNDEFQCHIRDDLTGLSLMAIALHGRCICA